LYAQSIKVTAVRATLTSHLTSAIIYNKNNTTGVMASFSLAFIATDKRALHFNYCELSLKRVLYDNHNSITVSWLKQALNNER